MFLAKKHLFSFLIVLSLSVLQFNTVLGIMPAEADTTLLGKQKLLTESAEPVYGSDPTDVKVIVTKLINTALSFLAIIILVLLLLAGFQYMTSEGNEAKTKEALDKIKALAIGLLIILSSWGITYYLLRLFICNTSTVGTTCSFW